MRFFFTLILIFIFSPQLFAQKYSCTVHINKGWKKENISTSIIYRNGRYAEISFMLGYHYGLFDNQKTFTYFSDTYIVNGKGRGAKPSYAFHLVDSKSQDFGIVGAIGQRFYLNKKKNEKRSRKIGIFYGNSFSYFQIKDVYNLTFKQNWNIPDYPEYQFVTGSQHFAAIRFATEVGYRSKVSKKIFLETSTSMALFIPLMKNYPVKYPYFSVLPEITLGAGYFL